jgi:hypothetical protein
MSLLVCIVSLNNHVIADEFGIGMFFTPDFPNDFTYPGGPLWDGEKLEQDYPPKL